jgi:hypothetical protein
MADTIEAIALKASVLAAQELATSNHANPMSETEEESDDHDDELVSGGSEYYSSSEDYTSSSSYLSSGDESKFIFLVSKASQLKAAELKPTITNKPSGTTMKRRSTSMTALEEEMSTMEVAALLNQARLCDAKHQTKAMRRSSFSSTRSSLSADPSFKSPPSNAVKHIQGQSQGSELLRNSAVNPSDLYNDILVSGGYTPRTIPCEDVNGFFLGITSDRLNSYSKDIIGAITSSDMNFLRMAHNDLNRNMNCCNRFGESVLHTACRRGLLEVVKFLINEAKVDVRVRDDYGRTPAHDACWQAEPNMELIEIILNQYPDLLLITDKRGFTPLQYVRKDQWPAWVELFKKNQFLPKRLLHADDSKNFIAVST